MAAEAKLPANKPAEKKNQGFSISVRSYITVLCIIFALMLLTYGMTLLFPGGAYDRTEAGELIDGSYHFVEGGLPIWKWLLSPFLVLGASGSSSLIAVIVFLLVIGGVFNALGEYGFVRYLLEKITGKYGSSRYKLMAILIFFFMTMGALIGSFEEVVPLVPIVVALSLSLGWDRMTGMNMSLLAVSCGFASGVCNPFTVGVAQELAGLPLFSGIWLRALSFVLIYGLLLLFSYIHARHVEQPILDGTVFAFTKDPKMDKGILYFGCILGLGILLVISSAFIKVLQDYTMIIVAIMFLVAGLVSLPIAGMKPKALFKSFMSGLVGMLPAVLMLLMASSIKYTMETANILDTILYSAMTMAASMPRWAVVLFIYLTVLVINFFISSGSAKAFMLIPLIVPLAAHFGIPAQLCIMAFAFGDGFSNVIYPTNPALLVSLGLADISYDKWFRHSIKFQVLNLLLTSGMLLLGLFVGYGS